MIHTAGPPIFAKLLFVFTYIVDSTKYPLVLVEPLDHPKGLSVKDRDLGFYRLRRNPRVTHELFSAHSIIRGALVVEDFAVDGDFLVVDTIDGDMFLRVQLMTE